MRYSVSLNHFGKWNVVFGFGSVVLIDLEFELAEKIANKLNDAYEDGRREAKEEMRDRISGLIFGED